MEVYLTLLSADRSEADREGRAGLEGPLKARPRLPNLLL